MKQTNIWTFFFALCFLSLQAQEEICQEKVEIALGILNSKTPVKNYKQLFENLEACAHTGNAKAQNYIGLFYIEGLGTEKNLEKGFEYLQRSSEAGCAIAQYNLGMLYKYGKGCEIDFTMAIDWFGKATANGNKRAAYALGYMYFKGFGVAQDYEQAVYWFERSDYPMAKHFLGICYYFGYGVAANENTALEILLGNEIQNSKQLVAYIKANKPEEQKEAVHTILNTDAIVSEVAESFQYEEDSEEILEKTDLLKSWKGSLIQYDWSGTKTTRITPIEIELQKKGTYMKAICKIAGQEKQSAVLWQDQTLYLEDLNFDLEKLYSADPTKPNLAYSFLSVGLIKKEYQGISYLTGSLDTYIDQWTEYGEPMSLVLQASDSEVVLTQEELLVLAEQEAQFIKLYPVPFKEKLLIQYTLKESANVQVALTSFGGDVNLTLDSGIKHAGSQTIQTTPEIPQGLYIVKVTVGSKVYTRMLIKEN